MKLWRCLNRKWQENSLLVRSVAGKISLKFSFPRLFRITRISEGSTADHWDFCTSWSVTFGRLQKEEEINDFQALLPLLAGKKLLSAPDKRMWSLETSGSFSVKSLVNHLSAASPLENSPEICLWKSNSSRRVNITLWIMLFGNLNCAAAMQRKLLSVL